MQAHGCVRYPFPSDPEIWASCGAEHGVDLEGTLEASLAGRRWSSQGDGEEATYSPGHLGLRGSPLDETPRAPHEPQRRLLESNAPVARLIGIARSAGQP